MSGTGGWYELRHAPRGLLVLVVSAPGYLPEFVPVNTRDPLPTVSSTAAARSSAPSGTPAARRRPRREGRRALAGRERRRRGRRERGRPVHASRGSAPAATASWRASTDALAEGGEVVVADGGETDVLLRVDLACAGRAPLIEPACGRSPARHDGGVTDAPELRFETPERVALHLELAGLGARAFAYLARLLVIFLLWVFGLVLYSISGDLLRQVLGAHLGGPAPRGRGGAPLGLGVGRRLGGGGRAGGRRGSARSGSGSCGPTARRSGWSSRSRGTCCAPSRSPSATPRASSPSRSARGGSGSGTWWRGRWSSASGAWTSRATRSPPAPRILAFALLAGRAARSSRRTSSSGSSTSSRAGRARARGARARRRRGSRRPSPARARGPRAPSEPEPLPRGARRALRRGAAR